MPVHAPIIAGESERLREVWWQLALPVRASHRHGRVHTALRGVVVTGMTVRASHHRG
jgi:hypothetical protein